MINFRDNFFFAKFAILFFLLTIFGYWGIDLNSEELYIAFSFFLLVIVGFILVKKALVILFLKSVNVKYFRFLSDLLVTYAGLTFRVAELHNLSCRVIKLRKFSIKFVSYFASYFFKDFDILSKVASTQRSFFKAILALSANLFFSNLSRIKKFRSFGAGTSKFFPIKL